MSQSQQNRFRFAPSPNGYMHLGHAYSALLNWKMAEQHAGEVLLRIEDIDQARSKTEFITAIYEDLTWLGLDWPQPVIRQSERFAYYQAALDQLKSENLIYPAFLSRGEIKQAVVDFEKNGKVWPKDPDGVPLYPDVCRVLSQAERDNRIRNGCAFTWRLDMKKAIDLAGSSLSWIECDQHLYETVIKADPMQWGDVVVARKDVPTSYHLSVVLDDAEQEINMIVRGQDLYASTSIHRLLQTILGLPEPHYYHHKLILDDNGRKLSKSDGDTSIRTLREIDKLSASDVKALIKL